MKNLFTFIGFILVVCIFGVLLCESIKRDGYKKGQIDAMNGIYKYKLDTTKVIKYIEIK
jgi:hypothetical protein